MTFWLLLIAYGIIQGIFLILGLTLDKRLQKRQKYLLIALVLSLSLLSTDYVLSNFWLINGMFAWPAFGFANAFWLAIGPLFYLSLRAFLPGETLSPKVIGWHLSPVLFSLLINIPFMLLPVEERLQYWAQYSQGEKITLLHSLSKLVYHLQLLIYPFLLLKLFKNQALHLRSPAGLLTGGLLLLGVASFVHLLAFNFLNLSFGWITSNLVFVSLTFFIQTLALVAISRPEWLFISIKKTAVKYANSNLANLNLPQTGQRLQQLMEIEKVYRDPNLNLSRLAEQLSISPHQLSEFLNRKNQMTFGEYINHFRVKEAQVLLLKENCQHLTIQAIAYDVGFNSNTTFYRYFKKHTGLSPANWIKGQNRNEKNSTI
ncbi:MAG: hypothetical protein DHS20C18_35340 [Saprospiraceae bacterium]|nr:MAG: hypothetical protein DHS20C18_35340 [Saprospiraceae bacterium]